MDILGTKSPALKHLVAFVLDRLPDQSAVVVDHWEGDPDAIGIARRSDTGWLVYIHAEKDANGRYFLSRELPPNSDLWPFEDAGSEQFDDLDTLANAVKAHLGGMSV